MAKIYGNKVEMVVPDGWEKRVAVLLVDIFAESGKAAPQNWVTWTDAANQEHTVRVHDGSIIHEWTTFSNEMEFCGRTCDE